MAKREVDDSALMALAENSMALQRAITDLAINLKELSEEMGQLLLLFKEASKTITEEKTSKEVEKEELRGMNEKVDHLIDQNRTIAKGLILMESAMRDNLEKKQSVV